MATRLLGACVLLAAPAWWCATAPAQEPAPAPAVLELLLPAGATATADGKAVDDPRAVTVGDFKPNEIRRLKVDVKFAGGGRDERLIDISAGQRLRVAVPTPGPEPATVVSAHALVPINSVAVAAGGKYLAFGLDTNVIALWDTALGRPVRTLAGHQKPVLSVAFTPDGTKLLSGSADATAILWDVASGTRLRTYKGHAGSVVSVAFGPAGKQFLSGSPEGLAILWDTDTGEPIHKLKSRAVLGVAYSPDGATLATASADATATLWDAKTGKQTVVLRGHREDVNCVAFSRDGRRVITGSSDDSGAVWDAAAGTRTTRTRGHTVNIHSAAFTPDGRRVITGEREELVVLCDATTGTPVRTFVGHSAEILSIIPSPDGRTLLTGSRDGTARLWDLATGRELLTLTTDGTGKEWAAVSPDGLFDASEAGRAALAYRFPKGGFGEVDQFFAEGFRPGLLAEVWRGERPFPAKPLGRNKPPLVKLLPPKDPGPSATTASLVADVVDQGSGVGRLAVENNGIRLTVPTTASPSPTGKGTRLAFTVPLVPGSNRISVRIADREGTRESAASEIELTQPSLPGPRGRLYVVAVGIDNHNEKELKLDHARKDATAIAEFLRARGGKLHDRVDVVTVFDKDATRAAIADTVSDVAELTRPQDTLVVVLCGHGAFVGERLHFAPHDLRLGGGRPADALQKGGVALDDIAAAMGTAPALNRVLLVDTAPSAVWLGGAPDKRSEFALRGAVERWSRGHGVHALAVVGSDRVAERPALNRGLLVPALREAAGENAVEADDWLSSAAERATAASQKLAGARQDVEASSRSKGFPLLAPEK